MGPFFRYVTRHDDSPARIMRVLTYHLTHNDLTSQRIFITASFDVSSSHHRLGWRILSLNEGFAGIRFLPANYFKKLSLFRLTPNLGKFDLIRANLSLSLCQVFQSKEIFIFRVEDTSERRKSCFGGWMEGEKKRNETIFSTNFQSWKNDNLPLGFPQICIGLRARVMTRHGFHSNVEL